MSYRSIHETIYPFHSSSLTGCYPNGNFGSMMTDNQMILQQQNAVSQSYNYSCQKSHDNHLRNTLIFTPNGFHQKLSVHFPDSSRSLVVCKACKRRGKTREYCRIQKYHTDVPWTNAYLCIIIDESCLQDVVTEETNKAQKKLRKVFVKDKHIDAHVICSEPFEMKVGSFDEKSMPVCGSCKEKNYTRSYCRMKKRHLQLPWNTENVVLTCSENSIDASRRITKHSFHDSSRGSFGSKHDPLDSDAKTPKKRTSEDINNIDPSRVFLLKFSYSSNELYWLDKNDEVLSSSIAQVYGRTPYNQYDPFFYRWEHHGWHQAIPTVYFPQHVHPPPRNDHYTPSAYDQRRFSHREQIVCMPTQMHQGNLNNSHSMPSQHFPNSGEIYFDQYQRSRKVEFPTECHRVKNEIGSYDSACKEEESENQWNHFFQ